MIHGASNLSSFLTRAWILMEIILTICLLEQEGKFSVDNLWLLSKFHLFWHDWFTHLIGLNKTMDLKAIVSKTDLIFFSLLLLIPLFYLYC
ncbi:hypothetical protein CFP56_011736 [Quercus suber]|uniref:Uncharacterized protein n=1 Tax=Quercus suber TaxID=58331 RepID=A0AAW0KZF6_QUESU